MWCDLIWCGEGDCLGGRLIARKYAEAGGVYVTSEDRQSWDGWKVNQPVGRLEGRMDANVGVKGIIIIEMDGQLLERMKCR